MFQPLDLDLDGNRQTFHQKYHTDVTEVILLTPVSFQSKFEDCYSCTLHSFGLRLF